MSWGETGRQRIRQIRDNIFGRVVANMSHLAFCSHLVFCAHLGFCSLGEISTPSSATRVTAPLEPLHVQAPFMLLSSVTRRHPDPALQKMVVVVVESCKALRSAKVGTQVTG